MELPDKVINYKIYLDGKTFLGVGNITLPTFSAISDTVKGAGLLGEFETPVIGQFSSTTITIEWTGVSEHYFQFIEPRGYHIDLFSANQIYNTSNSQLEVVPLQYSFVGIPKNVELGKLEVASAMGSNTEFEVVRFLARDGDLTVLELDKPNFKFVVNGKDILTDVRNALN